MPQKSIPCASGHMMRTTTKLWWVRKNLSFWQRWQRTQKSPSTDSAWLTSSNSHSCHSLVLAAGRPLSRDQWCPWKTTWTSHLKLDYNLVSGQMYTKVQDFLTLQKPSSLFWEWTFFRSGSFEDGGGLHSRRSNVVAFHTRLNQGQPGGWRGGTGLPPRPLPCELASNQEV